MMFRVELSKKAKKYLRSLDKKARAPITHHIKILSQDPRHPELDIKKFHGKFNLYRLRIGSFRVLYSIKDEVLLIVIVKVNPHGDVINSSRG
jgi:mRNA interferase RelE/StbE